MRRAAEHHENESERDTTYRAKKREDKDPARLSADISKEKEEKKKKSHAGD